MKNPFFSVLLLGTAIFIFGCSGSEDIVVDSTPPNTEVRTWTVSVYATGDAINGIGEDGEVTRAVFYGGNNGHRFSFIWDDGDTVEVYKGSSLLGTLTPSVTGQESTLLEGTLTGSIAVNDVLNLYLPGRAYDYSDQDASLGDLSLRHAYQQSSTTVTEAKESGNTLSLATTRMDHAQAYWWLRLTDENGDRIHPTRIQIYGTSGKMVKTKAIDGTATYFTEAEPLDVTVAKSDDGGEYPGEAFLSIRNENGSADTYKFKVWVGEDVYVGPSDRALTYTVTNGRMDNVKRQVQKTTPAASLTISDIPSRVFTGSVYEPVLTVKDGETTLTQGTDYTVAYSNHTDVGTATAIVTGLAEAGATCATPYLGSQEKTFAITKATPVVTIDGSTMTLVNNATQNTATRQVTSVYLDNSAYDIANLNIMAAPYSCTVTYISDNEGVATVDPSTGQVTAVGPGTCTITATVAEAANWLTNAIAATYTVNVEQEVNGQNGVNPWGNGDTEGGTIYVE